MLKKTMVLAVAVAALAALVPSMANAEAKSWTNKKVVLTGANAAVTTHGTVGFTAAGGGVHCPTTATAELEPGSTGTVTSFSASDTSKCVYNGTLAAVCASPVTLHESTKLPWTIHATKLKADDYAIVVTNLEVHVDGTGAFCPNVTVTGNAWLTAANPHEVTTLTVTNKNTAEKEGEAIATLHRTGAGHVTATGSVEITPAATYGTTT